MPTILPFRGITPAIAGDAFVAPGCRLIGDVEIGAGASIWYNSVLRGDIGRIRVGARSNLQDGTVVHVEGGRHDTLIGDDVLVGHMAMLHGCIVHDRAFVGMGATVMDGCEIEPQGRLAAGALLTPGKRLPARQLWAGRPARYMRDLTEAEVAGHDDVIRRYVALAAEHRAALMGV